MNLYVCNESWCFRLGQKGGEGRENCLKYFKRGWNNRKEGRGGKLGQGVGALKTEGLEPPYELCAYKNIKKIYTKIKFHLKYFILSLFVFLQQQYSSSLCYQKVCIKFDWM